MNLNVKQKFVVLEYGTITQPVWDESEQGYEEVPIENVPIKFVEYNEDCPTCHGSQEELCSEFDEDVGQNVDYVERCSYCDGQGYIKCWECKSEACFSTEKGWFCEDCLDPEYIRAFRIGNPDFMFEGESNADFGKEFSDDGAVVLNKG